MDTNIFPESPFEPGHHVSPDKFKGREEDINKIIRYMPKIINQGIPEHFFIIGKRGMGKTSFVKFMGNKVEEEFHMLPIYLNNEGQDKLEDLIQSLLEAIFKELDKTKKGQKIIEEFIGSINEIKLPGIGISLKNKEDFVENVKNNFADFLLNISKSLKEKNGLFIIIDDINGLSKTSEFPNWYKGLSETIDFSDNFVPVAFTLVSYKENFNKLTNLNPSFSRIFHLIEIDHLNDEDIELFFIENFEKYNIRFENKKALKHMVYYSWGMPLVMQQIGEETFWNVKNDLISEEIVFKSVLNASIELGNKQISLILDQIENDEYENILLKLGKHKLIEFEIQTLKRY
ncbi:AAA family ATPase [Methanobrevibacter sp.]|uniref:AAA family ATPase n=1 Tax=Methanobrevibacter sp. TaxID=66852 RepID=UPI00388EE9BF